MRKIKKEPPGKSAKLQIPVLESTTLPFAIILSYKSFIERMMISI
jgi:hypothetical protein